MRRKRKVPTIPIQLKKQLAKSLYRRLWNIQTLSDILEKHTMDARFHKTERLRFFELTSYLGHLIFDSQFDYTYEYNRQVMDNHSQ